MMIFRSCYLTIYIQNTEGVIMATQLIVLPIAQVGAMTDIISGLEVASTAKDIKRCKRQIYAFLQAIRPKQFMDINWNDLETVRRSYSSKNHDVAYEFWYSNSNEES
jgi:hypothetical protein